MRHPFAAVLLLACLAAAPASAAETPAATAPAQPNRYHLTLPAGAQVAAVEADLWLPTAGISLFNVMSVAGLPNGQADLLANLVATDEAGKPLRIEPLPEGDYQLAGASFPARVHLRYDVRLEHDRYTWPAGMEEVSYRTGEGVMATGFALFLAPTERTDSPIEVGFTLPAGWSAHTAWATAPPTSGQGPGRGDQRFTPTSRRDLLSNALFLGTAHSETVTLGGVEIRLVLGRQYVATRELFLDLLSQQLQSYQAMFGGPPLAPRYLIIVNQGATGDGGAFSGSFSQFIKGDADRLGRVIWGHVMAHELLHFWNGLSIVPEDSREEWFKEGVTDYLTIATTAKNGVMSPEVVLDRLENLNRRYVLARLLQGLTMSVRAAGEKKQEHRLLVYAGGSLAGLALDVELRRASGDKVGLPDLMRALYREFAAPGRTYTLADLERLAKEISGLDVHPLLARTVDSEELIDPTASLQALGLRLDQFYEEQFITLDAAATPQQVARRQAIFGF